MYAVQDVRPVSYLYRIWSLPVDRSLRFIFVFSHFTSGDKQASVVILESITFCCCLFVHSHATLTSLNASAIYTYTYIYTHIKEFLTWLTFQVYGKMKQIPFIYILFLILFRVFRLIHHRVVERDSHSTTIWSLQRETMFRLQTTKQLLTIIKKKQSLTCLYFISEYLKKIPEFNVKG